MLSEQQEEVIEPINSLLEQSRQIWLLGAGISKEAGIPLMWKLTILVRDHLGEMDSNEEPPLDESYDYILDELHNNANVEDVLDQIGNFIDLSNRKNSQEINVDEKTWDVDYLPVLHDKILESIRYIVRNGSDPSQEDHDDYSVWDREGSNICIDYHKRFVDHLFQNRPDAGDPVLFFTTNYDTLLEDAIGLCRKELYDGFTGGSVAYWNPRDNNTSSPDGNYDAHIYKLHGSIDWVQDGDAVLRTRHHPNYHDEGRRLLIYPQATKYELMQRAPFGNLFQKFRRELFSPKDGLLAICGYSFDDRHINDDIERALNSEKSNLTLLAFTKEITSSENENEGAQNDNSTQLPGKLIDWLESDSFANQVIVATNKGLYRGSSEDPLNSIYNLDDNYELDWWTLQGLTDFIEHSVPNHINVTSNE